MQRKWLIGLVVEQDLKGIVPTLFRPRATRDNDHLGRRHVWDKMFEAFGY
jgi:hypothetical protein